jgi:hypothetical protein
VRVVDRDDGVVTVGVTTKPLRGGCGNRVLVDNTNSAEAVVLGAGETVPPVV